MRTPLHALSGWLGFRDPRPQVRWDAEGCCDTPVPGHPRSWARVVRIPDGWSWEVRAPEGWTCASRVLARGVADTEDGAALAVGTWMWDSGARR
jgi:hypothetical protein